ncbi:hypothetical protein C0J08_14715 [Marinomonas sp. CT5]|uniref:hypothetical protein n=1 Tax=Marinomonas sp. CT5 TaxID=2066133 RepID=UPI001BB05592|nr:hypothetical protein [Marinomonas sp. CT5]QUX96573.1 hypothetical protein C0J08_14715 [Marinomonas sp. CT5]
MFSEKRPTMNSEILIAAAISNGYDHDEARDIAHEYSSHMDGYDLAKDLDKNCSWDTSRETVDELDEVIGEAEGMLKALEYEWVARNNIQQPLKNGTRIKDGIIDGVYEHQAARYKVIRNGETAESCSRLIIKFEDAVLVDQPQLEGAIA